MKKIIMMLTLMMSVAVAANAQTALVDNGTAKDNWYIGGGIGTNVWNNGTSWTMFNDKSSVGHGITSSWWRTQPLHVNVTVGKMFNPYVGAEVDYSLGFNLCAQPKFLDSHNLSGNVIVNLTNTILGYGGVRKGFELELIGGAGWLHNFNSADIVEVNALTVRGALRGNFNLSKNFAITVTPEYVYTPKYVANSMFTKHGVNLSVGVKYRIPTKRGNFPKCKLYDELEVYNLNKKINTLIATNDKLAKANAEMAETIKKLVNEGGKVKVKTNNVDKLYFNQGSADVDAAKVEMVAKALKDNTGTITLTGSTSPEGSEKVNKVLAQKRAESVKKALIANGVDESRITIKNDYENQRNVTITVE